MKRALVIATSVICLGCTPLYASEPKFGSGAGVMTCAEFASGYKQEPYAVEQLNFTWAQGYMTASNFALNDPKQYLDLGLWTNERQMSHIRGYCDAHPLQYYVSAVLDLIDAMKRDAETGRNRKP